MTHEFEELASELREYKSLPNTQVLDIASIHSSSKLATSDNKYYVALHSTKWKVSNNGNSSKINTLQIRRLLASVIRIRVTFTFWNSLPN